MVYSGGSCGPIASGKTLIQVPSLIKSVRPHPSTFSASFVPMAFQVLGNDLLNLVRHTDVDVLTSAT